MTVSKIALLVRVAATDYPGSPYMRTVNSLRRAGLIEPQVPGRARLVDRWRLTRAGVDFLGELIETNDAWRREFDRASREAEK